MTKDAINKASPLMLFRHVFGMQPGQTLSEFLKECGSLRDDTMFVGEVREYAYDNATE